MRGGDGGWRWRMESYGKEELSALERRPQFTMWNSEALGISEALSGVFNYTKHRELTDERGRLSRESEKCVFGLSDWV